MSGLLRFRDYIERMKKMALLLALAFVVIPAHASTWDEYRVVLKDGSWLTASGQPEALDDEAHMRLPGGLLAIEEIDLIDWQQTRAWNFHAVYQHNVVAGSAPMPLDGDNPDGPLELPTDAPVPLPDRETVMRLRILELAEELGALKERWSVIEKTAATTSSPRRALEMRGQAEHLDKQIRTLRSEQARLILQLPTSHNR